MKRHTSSKLIGRRRRGARWQRPIWLAAIAGIFAAGLALLNFGSIPPVAEARIGTISASLDPEEALASTPTVFTLTVTVDSGDRLASIEVEPEDFSDFGTASFVSVSGGKSWSLVECDEEGAVICAQANNDGRGRGPRDGPGVDSLSAGESISFTLQATTPSELGEHEWELETYANKDFNGTLFVTDAEVDIVSSTDTDAIDLLTGVSAGAVGDPGAAGDPGSASDSGPTGDPEVASNSEATGDSGAAGDPGATSDTQATFGTTAVLSAGQAPRALPAAGAAGSSGQMRKMLGVAGLSLIGAAAALAIGGGASYVWSSLPLADAPHNATRSHRRPRSR